MSEIPRPIQSNEKTETEQNLSEIRTFSIEDKQGNQFQATYFRILPGGERLPEESPLDADLPELRQVMKEAFPHYTDQTLDNFIAGIKDRSVVVLRSPEGQIVGLQTYRQAEISGYGDPIRAIYQNYFAVRPSIQSAGLTSRGLSEVLRIEKPELTFGHTSNPGTYLLNDRVASELGYEFYPKSGKEVPESIFQLGQNLGETFAMAPELDNRLVLTYDGPTSKGTRPLPYFEDDLHLGPNQGIRYMLLDQKFHERVLGLQRD